MRIPGDPQQWRVGLVGYGEVGQILAEDLRARGLAVSAYDIKRGSTADAPLRTHAGQYGVGWANSHAELVSQADLVVSAVTASQTVLVAEACAIAVNQDAYFLDFNSASPAAKITAAACIVGGGARYVEGAVMTAIAQCRIRVPLLLGGPSAAALQPLLVALGFDAKVASATLGIASATKMCRSVMIKGLEAMVIESFTAARAYGVEDQLLASLAETFPGIDWEEQGGYFFQRAIQHGRRRAEEMREAAATVRDVGLEPWSAAGTAERQAWVGELANAGVFGGGDAGPSGWRRDAGRILEAVKVGRHDS